MKLIKDTGVITIGTLIAGIVALGGFSIFFLNADRDLQAGVIKNTTNIENIQENIKELKEGQKEIIELLRKI